MAIDTMKKGSIEMLTLFLLCEGLVYRYYSGFPSR